VTRARLWATGVGGILLACGLILTSQSTGVQLAVLPLRGGDSLFVDEPGSKHDLLIDAGDASAVEQIIEPFLRARGVNRLARLVLTHGDVRHVGGAAILRDEFRVRQTITSRVRSRSPAYRQLIKALELAPASWREVERGDTLCGWRVLHPTVQDRFSRADDNALVLFREFEGIRVLLCSDLGRSGQRTLSEREPELRADVVIAGMPSPDEPLSNGLLQLLRPGLVVISAGEYPASERPSRALRERLRAQGRPVVFTCDRGAVYLRLIGGEWHARSQDGWEASGDAASRACDPVEPEH
jgi:competence protein ComEC